MDILFNTEEDYQAALRSNAFTKDNIAKVLEVKPEEMLGCYYLDAALAIKISRYRRKISGAHQSRDVFGAQQQMKLVMMQVPIYKR
jgi:hypothetical protein